MLDDNLILVTYDQPSPCENLIPLARLMETDRSIVHISSICGYPLWQCSAIVTRVASTNVGSVYKQIHQDTSFTCRWTGLIIEPTFAIVAEIIAVVVASISITIDWMIINVVIIIAVAAGAMDEVAVVI